MSITEERILNAATLLRVKTLEGKFLENNIFRAASERQNNEDNNSSDGLDENMQPSSLGDGSPIAGDDDSNKDPRSLFSSADILWMTRHEIDNVRATSQQSLKIGDMKITLFQGQSIGIQIY